MPAALGITSRSWAIAKPLLRSITRSSAATGNPGSDRGDRTQRASQSPIPRLQSDCYSVGFTQVGPILTTLRSFFSLGPTGTRLS